jgi:hypothetical protein
MSEFFRRGFQHGDNRSGNTALPFPKNLPDSANKKTSRRFRLKGKE